MGTLKIGSEGAEVVELQIQLNLVMLENLLPDGKYGNFTAKVVTKFQEAMGIAQTGNVDADTQKKLKKEYDKRPKFLVVADAGHGGINPTTGKYETVGKSYEHKGSVLHNGSCMFYEGVENRIVANKFQEELRTNGILTVLAHHPYKDFWNTDNSSDDLSRRGHFAKPYLERGFSGYYHSFHSNAISSSNGQEKMDKTRGGTVFTTDGATLSDEFAKQLLINWASVFGTPWVRVPNKECITTTSDSEANFAVLWHNERMVPNLQPTQKWAAILEEFGFFTSRPDAEFIIKSDTRFKRVQCAVNLAKYVYEQLAPKPRP